MEDALAAARGTGQQEYLDAGAGGAGDELVFLFGLGADDLGEMEDRNQAFRLAVLVGDDWIAGLPIGAAGLPRRAVLGLDRGAVASTPGQACHLGSVNRLHGRAARADGDFHALV